MISDKRIFLLRSCFIRCTYNPYTWKCFQAEHCACDFHEERILLLHILVVCSPSMLKTDIWILPPPLEL